MSPVEAARKTLISALCQLQLAGVSTSVQAWRDAETSINLFEQAVRKDERTTCERLMCQQNEAMERMSRQIEHMERDKRKGD